MVWGVPGTVEAGETVAGALFMGADCRAAIRLQQSAVNQIIREILWDRFVCAERGKLIADR